MTALVTLKDTTSHLFGRHGRSFLYALSKTDSHISSVGQETIKCLAKSKDLIWKLTNGKKCLVWSQLDAAIQAAPLAKVLFSSFVAVGTILTQAALTTSPNSLSINLLTQLKDWSTVMPLGGKRSSFAKTNHKFLLEWSPQFSKLML